VDNVNSSNNKKKKIFLISDHALAPSGVGRAGLWLAEGLIKTGKYQVFQFGGAVKHSNYNPVKVDPYGDDFRIIPVDGFGDKMKIRTALAMEKPDIMLLFTDPRFFIHIFEMEDEVHDVCPIAYWNIWDNYPTPKFNHVLYDSCDLLNCINKVAYNSINDMGLEHKCNFITHTLPPGLNVKLSEYEIKKHKEKIFGKERADHKMVLWVNRNARRKQPGDLLMGWKQFIEKTRADNNGESKATLVMHCDPMDQEGPNLFKMIEHLDLQDSVFLSRAKLDQPQMNILYNCADWNIMVPSAEGFGLSVLEAKTVGVPSIVHRTGGLVYQNEDEETGERFGIGKDTDCRCLVGSQVVPFIEDNYLTWETIAEALHEAYTMPKDDYDKLSQRCVEDAKERFNYDDMIKRWDETITETIEKFNDPNKVRFTKETL